MSACRPKFCFWGIVLVSRAGEYGVGRFDCDTTRERHPMNEKNRNNNRIEIYLILFYYFYNV